jgi:hypothetical protein
LRATDSEEEEDDKDKWFDNSEYRCDDKEDVRESEKEELPYTDENVPKVHVGEHPENDEVNAIDLDRGSGLMLDVDPNENVR